MNTNEIIDEVAANAQPFTEKLDLSSLINAIKDKKIVMLGESTHGTHEFYRWRLEISKELIENHGFNFIAVEGDWPPCQKINSFIQKQDLLDDPLDILSNFSRWPTWMWANYEMLSVMEWMSEFNQNNFSADLKAGFYGLDVYSLYESISTIRDKLESIDPVLSARVMRYYSCFDPYMNDEKAYARSLFKYPDGCKHQVAEALFEMLKKKITDINILQNASIVQQAERYYRAMISGEEAWNIRDEHMMTTLDKLIHHYGPESKCIVWAHNTHIGDHRATDMLFHGQVNIGGLSREKWGEDNVALIGFTTYKGSVIAGHAWDGKIGVMQIPEAKKGSLEDLFHQASLKMGQPNFFLITNQIKNSSLTKEYFGHRAIGVVYHPASESQGNYVPTLLTKRYDGMFFFNESSALTPLRVQVDREKIPETYPFGARI